MNPLTWMASVSIVFIMPRNFAISAESAKKRSWSSLTLIRVRIKEMWWNYGIKYMLKYLEFGKVNSVGYTKVAHGKGDAEK